MAARSRHPGTSLLPCGIGLAAVALVDAVVTIAGPLQGRPRVLAIVLAASSLSVCLFGWRRFGGVGRCDAVLAIAVDAWVLFDGGW
jgi:hypothetical protein